MNREKKDVEEEIYIYCKDFCSIKNVFASFEAMKIAASLYINILCWYKSIYVFSFVFLPPEKRCARLSEKKRST